MTASTGLRTERISEALRTFVRECGRESPRRAVLCTYELHPQRFNAVVDPELKRRGKEFRTLILADAGALQQHLADAGTSSFGRYQVAPVRCTKGGVFHAKVILLQAGAYWLAGAGSSNLTPGGLGGNLELMLFADSRTRDGRLLAEGVAGFLRRLIKSRAVRTPESAGRFIELATADLETKSAVLLDSLDTPLLDQMVEAHSQRNGRAAKTISVLSPWHSSTAGATPNNTDPQVIGQLRKRFRLDQPIHVYTQGKNGVGPDLGSNVELWVTRQADLDNHGAKSMPPDSDEGDPDSLSNRSPTTLHAKAYLVAGTSHSSFFFGSANCTQPALLKPASRGGNVEVLVASKLDRPSLRRILHDLQRVFEKGKKRPTKLQLRAPSPARGKILVGHLLVRNAKRVLTLDAPDVKHAIVAIHCAQGDGFRNPKTATVQATISDGRGQVVEPSQLALLFGGDVPTRASENWSMFLWEQVGPKKWLPFVVAVPLTESTSTSPDEMLQELLEEQRGWWPARQQSETTGNRRDEQSEETGELDGQEHRLLTQALHQGELDRIGVIVASLIRFFQGRKYHAGREESLHLLRQRIERMELAPHLKKVVLNRLPRPGLNEK